MRIATWNINSVKLHIVFNKVDAFKSLEDFGKAHGTLYWNLSAAMQRKDVPIVCVVLSPYKIFTSHIQKKFFPGTQHVLSH